MVESNTSIKDIQNQLKIEKLCIAISSTLSFMVEAPSAENDGRHSLANGRLTQDLSHLEMEFSDQDRPSKP